MSKRVLVTGAGGLVGGALCRSLEQDGIEVHRLVRHEPAGPAEHRWDPAAGTFDATDIRVDAVVHLAGESIAEGRWTAAKKARIRDSRVDGTRLLCEGLAGMDTPPGALVCASAIGFYGDRGDDVLGETSAQGGGFLAEVCGAWEAAADPARAAGLRVVHLRLGVVLDGSGGALAKMLTPFRLGVGGRIGSGRQFMSWITLDDLVQVIRHALDSDALAGPVNAVAPGALTNAEFTKALGRALRRPTIFPLPGPVARLVMGEMAQELLLASTRVSPTALEAADFPFRHPDINTALAAVLD